MMLPQISHSLRTPSQWSLTPEHNLFDHELSSGHRTSPIPFALNTTRPSTSGSIASNTAGPSMLDSIALTHNLGADFIALTYNPGADSIAQTYNLGAGSIALTCNLRGKPSRTSGWSKKDNSLSGKGKGKAWQL